MKYKVFVIDDEPAICVSIRSALKKDYDVSFATNEEEALNRVREEHFDVILLDLRLGNSNGVDVLKKIKQIDSETAVIMVTAYGSIRSSVDAMREGAFNYLTKPVELDELRIFIEQAISFESLNKQVNYLSAELQNRYKYGDMIGKSEVMQRVYQLVEKVKDVDCGVLLSGESGTGKELAARAIHYLGKRKSEKFVVVNCAAIPDGLLEEEFFGHKRGSFTGATTDKKGKVELADKGTLFLDEIGDLPLSLQGKLLRVLQQKEFSPIGSNEIIKTDIRLIAATNRNLLQMISEGSFRQDLYYRLNVVEICLPPLRERKEDISILAQSFVEQFSKEQNKNITGLAPSAIRALMRYSFPGNVRELRNIIEYSCIMCSGSTIEEDDLPRGISAEIETSVIPRSGTLADIERQVILESIDKNNGHHKKTAEELGISERSLRNKLTAYGWKNEN